MAKQRQVRVEQGLPQSLMEDMQDRTDEQLESETKHRSIALAILGARAAERYDAATARTYFQRAIAASRPQERMQIRRMADASLALVPPAFLARYGQELGLKPRMEAVLESGNQEIWSLVVKKGSVSSPAGLQGWEVTGAPGFAHDFVRGELLKGWGALPPDARITFTARVLTALRRMGQSR